MEDQADWGLHLRKVSQNLECRMQTVKLRVKGRIVTSKMKAMEMGTLSKKATVKSVFLKRDLLKKKKKKKKKKKWSWLGWGMHLFHLGTYTFLLE